MKIQELRVSGLPPIKDDQRLHFSESNFFIGINGSGKSSLMDELISMLDIADRQFSRERGRGTLRLDFEEDEQMSFLLLINDLLITKLLLSDPNTQARQDHPHLDGIDVYTRLAQTLCEPLPSGSNQLRKSWQAIRLFAHDFDESWDPGDEKMKRWRCCRFS